MKRLVLGIVAALSLSQAAYAATVENVILKAPIRKAEVAYFWVDKEGQACVGGIDDVPDECKPQTPETYMWNGGASTFTPTPGYYFPNQ